MKVSVCIQTYNHEPFIAQALDSVLMQETDFDYEILLGEDDSSDGTREICREYARKHPERIRLFLNSRENVIYINGRPTGRWNFCNNVKNARGQYLALLDGDDFWVDPKKIQKQVSLLAEDSRFVLCATDSHTQLGNDVTRQADVSENATCRVYGIQDMIQEYLFRTCTVVVRREAVWPIQDWQMRCPPLDYSLWLGACTKGKIAFLPEATAVYRIHNGGIWMGVNTIARRRGTLATLEEATPHLGGEVQHVLRRRKSELLYECAHLELNNGNLLMAIKANWDAFKVSWRDLNVVFKCCRFPVFACARKGRYLAGRIRRIATGPKCWYL
ncbi:MAG: glycosyltransferase [Planctomycetaceae bacterium]|nr:glycosyltransferase [Planctomycetaceae bacterium]MCA9108619.1 glycosyltransferase [Planctomycetaceae bacterium]